MIGRAFLATFRAVLSDRSAFMLIVVSTILYSFFYPSAYSGEVAVRIPVAVVDLDDSGASRSLVRRIAALQQADLAARQEPPGSGSRRPAQGPWSSSPRGSSDIF